MPSASPSETAAAPRRVLTLFDSTCIIVGIIIGTMFYETSPLIAKGTASAAAFLGIWALGGAISLVGALCYAELATRFPEEGGDYVYLTRAFGRPMGFLFAWADLWIIRPGSIGAIAYVFARYADALCHFGRPAIALPVYAAGAVVFLTCINLLGVREEKWTQNLLAVLKILGLAAICAVALGATPPAEQPVGPAPREASWGLALILVLYAYGGWNELGYVGAEVRRPEKNLLRALVLGILAVTVLYVLASGAFVWVLGFAGVRQSSAVAAESMKRVFGEPGGRAISLLICLSALGAMNGQLFTGARIAYAFGRDHRAFRLLGRWNAARGIPPGGLLVMALAVLILLGLLVLLGQGEQGFLSLVYFTTPVCWTFFCLVTLGLMVLRFKQPAVLPPYRVPLYPLPPLLFAGVSLFLVYSGVAYAIEKRDPIMYLSLAILAAGGIGCFIFRNRDGVEV
ncbi:MAG: amino acid permease [Pirellulales bacterium]|nr:amino acid permease [Pirellulales bacterium]